MTIMYNVGTMKCSSNQTSASGSAPVCGLTITRRCQPTLDGCNNRHSRHTARPSHVTDDLRPNNVSQIYTEERKYLIPVITRKNDYYDNERRGDFLLKIVLRLIIFHACRCVEDKSNYNFSSCTKLHFSTFSSRLDSPGETITTSHNFACTPL